MTNSKIVFNQSLELMKEGILKGTGKYVTVQNEDGSKEQVEIPESIHTYQTWKQLGRQVKKGQKAIAQFPIWKYTSKLDKETGEEIDSNMFLKRSSWFTFDQTEAIAQ